MKGENLNEEDDEEKVYVCHKGKTLKIADDALESHLDHGDSEGKCDDDYEDKMDMKKSDYGGESIDSLRKQLEELLELLQLLQQLRDLMNALSA